MVYQELRQVSCVVVREEEEESFQYMVVLFCEIALVVLLMLMILEVANLELVVIVCPGTKMEMELPECDGLLVAEEREMVMKEVYELVQMLHVDGIELQRWQRQRLHHPSLYRSLLNVVHISFRKWQYILSALK